MFYIKLGAVWLGSGSRGREREREDLLSDAVLSHVVAERERGREGEGESLVSSTELKVNSR